jgi:hypothetical protein
MTQQPRLLVHVGEPLDRLLEISLEAHQLALNIDQGNADILLWVATQMEKLATPVLISVKQYGSSSNKFGRDDQ